MGSEMCIRDRKSHNDDLHFQEKVYLQVSQKAVTRWFHKIQNEKVKPNKNQLAYLHDIANRCMQEARELKDVASVSKKVRTTEPYRKCLLGPPGTGKSECLRWTSRFFEDVLDQRNDHLLEQIDRHAHHHPVMVIPWGALHISAIARGLQDRGFMERESEKRVVLTLSLIHI